MDLAPLVAAFILGVESEPWTYAGHKESFVREHLDIGMTEFYQRVNALIDTELALQIDAVTTNRLRSIRAHRQRYRFSRAS